MSVTGGSWTCDYFNEDEAEIKLNDFKTLQTEQNVF